MDRIRPKDEIEQMLGVGCLQQNAKEEARQEMEFETLTTERKHVVIRGCSDVEGYSTIEGPKHDAGYEQGIS